MIVCGDLDGKQCPREEGAAAYRLGGFPHDPGLFPVVWLNAAKEKGAAVEGPVAAQLNGVVGETIRVCSQRAQKASVCDSSAP